MRYNNALEFVASTFVEILSPLKSRFNKNEFRRFLGELGLPLPKSVESVSSVETDLNAIIGAVNPLLEGLQKLISAIKDKDSGKIVKEAKDIFKEIKPVFDNVKNLANTIKTLHTVISGLDPAQLNNFANNLPEKVFDYLVVTNFEKVQGLTEALEIIGVVERSGQSIQFPEETEPYFFIEKKLEIGNFFLFISDPSGQLASLYDWGTPLFDGTKLFTRLESISSVSGLPAIYDPVSNQLDIGFLELGLTNDNPINGLEIILREGFSFNGKEEILEDDWKIIIDVSLKLAVLLKIELLNDFNIRFIPPSGTASGKNKIEWRTVDNDEPYILIGEHNSSRLQIESFSSAIETEFKSESSPGVFGSNFTWKSKIENGKLIIDNRNSDGFLSNLLPELIESDFEIIVGWSYDKGFSFQGSSALEIDIPTHTEIGPIEISQIHLVLGLSNTGFNTSLGLSVKADLGPFKATVENIGLKTDITIPGEGGNLGSLNADLGFKFPEGIGLQIDASIVKGGGFLYIDVEKGEYAGVAELTIQNTVSLKAIGIINTKLPNGEDGFALLLLITAEFTPIQLGFGFTLNGVGGLIGANRGMNLAAIREGVRNDTLDHILFPDDPVANAPAIIANLNSVFPIAEGNHSFGIMGIIGWGTPTLLEVELGIMITFPTFDLAVIGKLSTSLPDKNAAILTLNVAFAGTMSFEKKYFFFDAAIFDSKLLTFSLSGQMALRILWGDEPNFVLSVGGFNPDFVPPPLELNDLERITLNLLADDNPRLTLQAYFAVTSNTVQFGASIDFLFKVSKFKVVGYLYFHALFQFDPFYFKIAIGAGLDVKLGSATILSVSVSGSLEGPTPWKVKGKGKFKILFISYSVSFSETWGETRDTSLPGVEIFSKLKAALSDDRNWTALLPKNNTLTTVREIPEEDLLDNFTIHPFGSLSLLQRVVPLKENIDLFGNQEPSDYNRFELSFKIDDIEIDSNEKKDFFAPAQFFNMSDSEKISKDAYVKYRAGIAADKTEDLTANHHINRAVEYEMEVLDSKDKPSKKGVYLQNAFQMAHWAKGSAIAKAELGIKAEQQLFESDKEIRLDEETYVIVNQADLTPITDVPAGSEIELQQMLDTLIAENPEKESELMVVSSFEIF